MYSNNKKKLFLFNSITGVTQLIITVALTFLCIPIFLRNLGDVQYGIFCATAVVGNLSTFANLSLDATLIKYLSEQGRSQESNYDILTTLIILVVVLLPLSIVLFLLKDIILLNLLKVPVEHLYQSAVLLKYLLIANFFLLVGKVFTAILDSEHKIYLNNLYTFIYSTVYWGGIIVVVLFGYGLEQIGLTICASALLWFLLVFYSAMKTWGKIRIGQLQQNFKRIVKKQLNYSLKIYTGSLICFLYEPLTKILISNLMGISFVGLYDIVLKIKANLLSVFSKILYPIYPMIAHEPNYDKLRNLIKNTNKLLFYLIIPIIVILIICSKSVISLWLGGKVDPENIPILTLSSIVLACFSLLLSTTVTPIYIFLRIKNHPEKEIYIQGVNVVVNMIVIALFFKPLGFYSIILGNVSSLIVSFILCTYYQKKHLHFYPFSGVKDMFKYTASFLFIGLITGLFSLLFQETTWANVIFVSLFSGLISMGIFYFMGIVKKEDVTMLLSNLGKKDNFRN
jgi:O-antigen/teichoic acid export membrane protein